MTISSIRSLRLSLVEFRHYKKSRLDQRPEVFLCPVHCICCIFSLNVLRLVIAAEQGPISICNDRFHLISFAAYCICTGRQFSRQYLHYPASPARATTGIRGGYCGGVINSIGGHSRHHAFQSAIWFTVG